MNSPLPPTSPSAAALAQQAEVLERLRALQQRLGEHESEPGSMQLTFCWKERNTGKFHEARVFHVDSFVLWLTAWDGESADVLSLILAATPMVIRNMQLQTLQLLYREGGLGLLMDCVREMLRSEGVTQAQLDHAFAERRQSGSTVPPKGPLQ